MRDSKRYAARMRRVELYFDFISPYSWLAIAHAEEFATRHGIAFDLRPVVYAAILNATGLTGPAEQPAKRRYFFVDVHRAARASGLHLAGPPAHPFRSLDALRLVTSQLDAPERALRLTVAVAKACWEGGRDIADWRTLAALASECGLAAGGIEALANAPQTKLALRTATDAALRNGVFGVPTFRYEGELFWGFDRMDALADVLAGRCPTTPVAAVQQLLDRPRAVDRRG